MRARAAMSTQGEPDGREIYTTARAEGRIPAHGPGAGGCPAITAQGWAILPSKNCHCAVDRTGRAPTPAERPESPDEPPWSAVAGGSTNGSCAAWRQEYAPNMNADSM